jgi:YggT family protein
MVMYFVHLIFQTYTILIACRVIGSWFPSIARSKLMRFIAFYTDPYLGFFRRIIPPIGGALDLSPLLGFLGLKFIESMVLKLLS